MGVGPSEFFDYENELFKSIEKTKETKNMSRRLDDFDDDEIDDLLGKYNFSSAASREIKKSLVHEPKKGSNKKVDSPDEIQNKLGHAEGVPASEYNKSDEFLDDDDDSAEDWKRQRKAQQRAEAKKSAEPVIDESPVNKSFSFSGDFRNDKKRLRGILEKAAWGQKERAVERLAELDLKKSENGLRYLVEMMDEDWFE